MNVKRIILPLVMTLAVLCAAIAVTVNFSVADGAETSFEHTDHSGWTQLTAGGEISGGTEEAPSKYYLDSDLYLNEVLKIRGYTVLCLNGHKLHGKTGSYVIQLTSTLVLCDCRTDSEHDYYVNDSGLYVFDDGTEDWDTAYSAAGEEKQGTIAGGVICGGGDSAISNSYGSLIMTGGNICGNTSGSPGGGVYVSGSSASFKMSGGRICGNVGNTDGGIFYCGGVYFVSGTFEMTGGEISENKVYNKDSNKQLTVQNSFDCNVKLSGGYLGGTIPSISRVSGGYLSEQPNSGVEEGYTVVEIDGTVGDPDYKAGFPYAVYKKGDSDKLSVNTGNVVYDGEAIEAGVDFTVGGVGTDSAFTFSYSTSDGEPMDGPPTNAGSYNIVVSYIDGANKTYYKKSFNLTISKAASSATVTAKDLTYNGSEQALVTGSATGGGLVYSLTQDGEYTSSVPKATNAGDYTVYYKVIGDANHLDSAGSVNVAVSKATPEYTVPTGINVLIGSELSGIVLPQGWTWTDKTQTVSASGNYEAEFTPDDTYNYETVKTGIYLTVIDPETHVGHDGWTQLTAGGEFTNAEGNVALYYLAGDVALDEKITVKGIMVLCLNGYRLSGNELEYIVEVQSGIFVLCDCDASREHEYYKNESGVYVFDDGTNAWDTAYVAAGAENKGVIKGGVLGGNKGRGVFVKGGTFRMLGGSLSGIVAADASGAVCVNGGTFEMSGGEISGNIVCDGGGVYVWAGSFTMSGGKISGNTTSANGSGGGVCVDGGTFKMSGGEISGNTASNNGGGVCVWAGSFTMSGGKISGNTATSARGGGVHVYGGGTFEMNGGEISGNKAYFSGNGVNIDDGTFKMSGGYIDGECSGTVSITGGYFSAEPDSAYIDENYASVYIDGTVGDPDYKAGFPYAVYKKVDGELSVTPKYDIVYDGKAIEAGVDFTVGGAGSDSTLTYSYSTTGEPMYGLPKDAGEYTVEVKVIDIENKTYYGTSFEITISKAASSATVTAKNLTYNGSGQELVTGSATGGELVYSLTEDGEYTESVPTATNAGDYTVYYKVKGDANHFDSEPQSVTVTVSKAASSASVTGNDLTYDGSEQVLVTGSATGGELVYSLTQDGKYTESVPTATNAGSYTVYYKVIGDANHLDSTGSVTVTVSKAIPEYTKPEFEAIDKDTDVYSIELPEGWTWKENSMRVNEDGDTVVTAIYDPDAVNYEAVEVELVIAYKKGLSGGAIAGIAIGCTLGAVLIAYGVCALLFKKKILKGAFFTRIYPFIK